MQINHTIYYVNFYFLVIYKTYCRILNALITRAFRGLCLVMKLTASISGGLPPRQYLPPWGRGWVYCPAPEAPPLRGNADGIDAIFVLSHP